MTNDLRTILTLIPLATQLTLEVAGAIKTFDISGVTQEDLTQALEDSKNWPELQFDSPVE